MKMNFLILLSLVIFCFFASSCSKADAVSLRQLNESAPSRVILEIEHLSYGSMDGFNGRTLGFRLYENGKFEYEEISNEKLKEYKGQTFTSEAISKKAGILSESELTEIREILDSKEIHNVKDYFKNAEGFCTCGASRTEIRYKIEGSYIKNINIDGSGCADLKNTDKKYFPQFPKVLSELIKQVQKITYPNSENS